MGSSNVVRSYVAVVAASAVVLTWFVAAATELVPGEPATILALVALAVLSQFLAFKMPRGGAASLAFVPFGAALIIAPDVRTLLVVAGAASIVPVVQRQAPLRLVFNVAQTIVGLALAIICYSAAGGQPLASYSTASFGEIATHASIAAGVMLLLVLLTNSLLVSVAIAISSDQPVFSVWKANTLITLAQVVFAVPASFLLAYLALKGGAVGVALLAVPLLGMRQLYKTSYDLQQVNQDLLELTVKAIEARDPYTSGHSRRVSETSRMIAEELRLGDREIERVTVAALLHDVGKIYEVFAPILQKPGRLTEEEWEIMKTHPVLGADLVATVAHLRHAVPSIRGHHENWDGTGYPDGLAGERIPLGARIIAVADTIDALLTDRPYRKRLTSQDVRAELVRCRGTQFDPRVCDVVLSAPLWGKLFPEDREEPGERSILALRRRTHPAAVSGSR